MKKIPILLNVLLSFAAVHSVLSIIFEAIRIQSFVVIYINEYGYEYSMRTAIEGMILSSAMILLALVTLVLSCTFLYLLNRKTDGVSVMDKIAYGADEAKKVMEKKKADKEEARKQKRLEELQAKIDELKK